MTNTSGSEVCAGLMSDVLQDFLERFRFTTLRVCLRDAEQ